MRVAATSRELAALLSIAALAALVTVVYANSYASMAHVWSYSAYSHGVLVFPISAYLLWRIRSSIAEADLTPWPWGLAVLAVLVFAWVVSRGVGVQAAEHLAAVLMVPAMIATCLGWELARRALFPLLFLAAAVPVGESLIPHLMRFTADASAALLRLSGMPVFRDGQFISLPGGDFEVADVCSGLRYLIAGSVIALLFSYLMYRTVWKRCLFVVIAALTLILANGVRAFVVMFVASHTRMRVFAGLDHVYFGWFLFGLTVGALFWFGSRYSDARPPAADAKPTSTEAGARRLMLGAAIAVVMLAVTAHTLGQSWRGTWLLLPAGILLLWTISRAVTPAVTGERRATAVAPAASAWPRSALVAFLAVAVLIAGPAFLAVSRSAGDEAAGTVVLPALPSCSVPGPYSAHWRPEWQSPDFSVAATYACDGGPVSVFIAGYQGNGQGNELVNESNRPMSDSWRRYVTRDESEFLSKDGRTIAVNEIRADNGADLRSLIWYWYAVGDRTATSPTTVKIIQALQMIKEGRSDGVVYWFETPLDAPIASSRQRLAALGRELEGAARGDRRTIRR